MIHVNERWEIDSDPRNYILLESHETVNKKTGKPTGKISTSTYGFYPSLSLALRAIVNQETLDIIGDGYISLREAIRRIEEIEQRVYKEFTECLKGQQSTES